MGKLVKVVKETVDIFAEGGASILSEIFLQGVAGQIAPGIVTISMSIKQKQLEKRVMAAIEELRKRQDNIERLLDVSSLEVVEFAKSNLFPIIIDNVIAESQEEKISLIINGFEESIEKQVTDEEIILAYYDTLSSLRLAEINHLLKEYTPVKSVDDLKWDLNLDIYMDRTKEGRKKLRQIQGYTLYINNKLEQLGLVQNIFQTTLDANEPFKDNMEITEYGKNFIDFFRMKQ